MTKTNSIMLANVNNLPTFKNADLNVATQKIAAANVTAAASQFVIAAIAANVKKNNVYVEDGFKTTADWLAHTFGYGKSSASNYVRAGEMFVEFDENGTPHCKVKDKNGFAFGYTQIVETLSLVSDERDKLIAEEKITAEMTASEIRKAVAAYKDSKKNPIIEGSATEKATEEEAEEEAEEVTEEATTLKVGNKTKMLKAINEMLSTYWADVKRVVIYNEAGVEIGTVER